MQISAIGIDLAKNVFQVHGVDAANTPRICKSDAAAACNCAPSFAVSAPSGAIRLQQLQPHAIARMSIMRGRPALLNAKVRQMELKAGQVSKRGGNK